MWGKIEGLDFDMDGVLIRSEELAEQSEREICARHRILVPRNGWDQFKGMRSRDIFVRIVAQYTDGSFDVDALTEERRNRYLELAETNLRPFDGALTVLPLAKRRFGDKMALTTSSSPPSQEQAFRKFGFGQFFSVVVTAADVKQGKPHPEAYLTTADRLNLSPEKIAVIEDSDNGIRAARAAGCKVVGITNTMEASQLWAAGAHEVIEELNDLLRLFKLFQ